MRRPQNLKKSPTCFDKTAVFSQQQQNKWETFLQTFVDFSEKLAMKGNNNYNFFDMVKLFVDLRRMEIYA